MWWLALDEAPAYMQYAVKASTQRPTSDGEEVVILPSEVECVAHNPGERLLQLMGEDLD